MTNNREFFLYRKNIASGNKVEYVFELAKLLIAKRKIKQLFNIFWVNQNLMGGDFLLKKNLYAVNFLQALIVSGYNRSDIMRLITGGLPFNYPITCLSRHNITC